jgi:hypothetical protein
LSKLYPSFKTQPSLDGRVYPVVAHNAKAMIESLLYSPLMDDDANLLFPNLDNPLEGPPPFSDRLDDVDMGKAYCRARSLLCTQSHHLNYVASSCILIRLPLTTMGIAHSSRFTSRSCCLIGRHATNLKLYSLPGASFESGIGSLHEKGRKH